MTSVIVEINLPKNKDTNSHRSLRKVRRRARCTARVSAFLNEHLMYNYYTVDFTLVPTTNAVFKFNVIGILQGQVHRCSP